MKRARAVVHKLAQQLGYDALRSGQGPAIEAALAGRDTLVVMPTGAGKSAIYQLAGLALPGPTVVISPLIALQRDQVDMIQAQEVGGAAQLNSTMSASERRAVLERLAQGTLEFIFLAPEQLSNPTVLEQLRRAKPSLFVVDEAHCISDWGHDFRPDYLRLGTVIEALGHPTVLALTATAAPPVREEILSRLTMRDPQVIVRGFDRPNIWLGVMSFREEEHKRQALLDEVVAAEKPGIVYAATRRRAEELTALLEERGVQALAYHAGLRPAEREQAQAAFMADQIAVIVATTAFGMGIDKPNVRFVFHYDISDSVDAYYQEIGRAGRDGAPARALLFYRPEDVGLRRFFSGGSHIDADQVCRIATLLHLHGGPVDPRELCEAVQLPPSKLTVALNWLEQAGIVERLPSGEVQACGQPPDMAALAEQAQAAQQRHQQFERSRVTMIQNYAELRDCRREFILNYFGEAYDGPCDACDTCDAGMGVPRDMANEPFPLSARVCHSGWGDGLVMRYEDAKIVVLFETVGYKTLALDLVCQRGLLALAEG